MAIDINELRKVIADCYWPTSPVTINELLDRLEAAEADALEQARLNGMGASREAALIAKLEAAEKERDDAKAAAENIALKLDYLRSKLETAENAQNEWLRANAPGGWIDNLRIENEALRAEVIHIKEVELPRKAQAVADGWRGKCERLEAKIAEMEKQEPK